MFYAAMELLHTTVELVKRNIQRDGGGGGGNQTLYDGKFTSFLMTKDASTSMRLLCAPTTDKKKIPGILSSTNLL